MTRGSTPSAPARLAVIAALLGLIGLLTACASAGAKARPTWTPQRTPSPVQLPTQIPPDGGGSAGTGGGTQAPNSSSPGGSGSTDDDPAVVAKNLTTPVGVAVLPDGSALVAERTTGRVVLVQPIPDEPVTLVKQLDGLNTANGGGLLDIALSASYSEDGIILALISTGTQIQVVHFTRTGPVTPIVTGIPFGASNNTGRLLVLGNGDVLIGTGDAGLGTGDDPSSLGGKILRVDDLGQPADDNPDPASPVYASGFDTVTGLCADLKTSTIFASESTQGRDYLHAVRAGQSVSSGRALPLPAAVGGVSGCTVVEDTFVVSGLGGKDIYQSQLTSATSFGPYSAVLTGKYGRIANVVGAPDGSVWLTTSNRDGQGTPVAADERVIHIQLSGGGGGKAPV